MSRKVIPRMHITYKKKKSGLQSLKTLELLDIFPEEYNFLLFACKNLQYL